MPSFTPTPKTNQKKPLSSLFKIWACWNSFILEMDHRVLSWRSVLPVLSPSSVERFFSWHWTAHCRLWVWWFCPEDGPGPAGSVGVQMDQDGVFGFSETKLAEKAKQLKKYKFLKSLVMVVCDNGEVSQCVSLLIGSSTKPLRLKYPDLLIQSSVCSDTMCLTVTCSAAQQGGDWNTATY